MKITTKVQAKSIVSALRRELKGSEKAPSSFSHNECLTLMAKALGFSSWNEWEATLSTDEKIVAAPVVADALSKNWSPAQGPMSEIQYTEYEGCRCPVCGIRDSISGGSWTADSGYAYQESSCDNCNSTWNDQYTLDGFSDMEREDGAETKAEALDYGFCYALQNWITEGTGDLSEDDTALLHALIVKKAHVERPPAVIKQVCESTLIEQLTYLRSSYSSDIWLIDDLAEVLKRHKCFLIL